MVCFKSILNNIKKAAVIAWSATAKAAGRFFCVAGKVAKAVFSASARVLRRFPRAVKGTVSVAIAASLAVGIFVFTGAVHAFEISVDGVTVGCVGSEVDVINAKNLAKQKIYDEHGRKQLERITYTGIVTSGDKVVAPEEVVEPILGNTKNLKSAATLTVNDSVIGFMDTKEEVQAALDRLVEEEKELYGADKAEVGDNVKIDSAYFSGDALQGLPRLDEILEEDVFLVPVKVTVYETSERTAPFSTVETKSDEVVLGATKVASEGADGINSVVESVSYINGLEVERSVVSTTTVVAPQDRVVLIGTKEPVVYTKSLEIPKDNLPNEYGYIWPVDVNSDYYISSYYGDGRGHKGFDIAAATGTGIYASRDGRVVYAGWEGNYGLSVIVDHGNGVKTRYAHCSQLFVSVGDTVKQGENIAAVGTTGQVTGAHLHFEIVVNGTAVDPAVYFSKQ